MNKKIIMLLVGVLTLTNYSTQAQKKNFTMAEAVNGMSSKFAPLNLKQLQWTGSSDLYSYVVNNDSEKKVYVVSPVNFERKALYSLDQLNSAMEAKGFKKLTSFPAMSFKSETNFSFSNDNKWIQADISAPNSIELELIADLPADAEATWLDTNKMSIAFVSNNNLFVNYMGGKPIQISKDGSSNLLYGKPVHRDEFGIDRGSFWSPMGNFLAFYRMDQKYG